jgi:hypothetical protein
MISPILFCVYLDTLLTELKIDGVGCFIGNWFVAALAYADDVVLLANTARAMRTIQAMRDKFVGGFNVTFIAKKSKSLTFNVHEDLTALAPTRLAIGGDSIENVSIWSHLGHLFNANLLNDDDILARCNSLIGQVNSFL